MTTRRPELLVALHRRFQAMQLKNLFISRAYGTSLTPIESHILVELALPKGLTQSELIAALGLHKVVVSRAVAGLVDADLVQVKTGSLDARSRVCSLTQKGRDVLELLDENANHLMRTFCNYLTKAQESRLDSLWNALCDGLNGPPVARRSGVHHLLVPGRRHSRCMGLLGTSVFGETALSSVEWHLLSLLRGTEGETAVNLVHKLGLIPASGTAVVHRLAQRGFLTSTPHPTDRRSQVLTLTDCGLQILKKVERIAVRQLELATRDIPGSEVAEMVTLFNRFGADLSISPIIELTRDLRVRVVTDINGITLARAFLIRALVEDNLAVSADPSVCSPDSLIVLLDDKEREVALIEVPADGCSVRYAVGGQKVPMALLSDFVGLSKDVCQQRWGSIPVLRSGGSSPAFRKLW
jgi:DNA-binding MarR family transcriptional regulator